MCLSCKPTFPPRISTTHIVQDTSITTEALPLAHKILTNILCRFSRRVGSRQPTGNDQNKV